MESIEINYKYLRKIQETEKNSPTLTKLYSDFYSDLSIYLTNLEKRLEKESSNKQNFIKEEIQNTKRIANKIYELREKKVILAAIAKGRGGEPDLTNLVDVEKNLFDSVLEDISKFRRKLISNGTKKDNDDVRTELPNEPSNTNSKENSNPIIRITKDIPEFIGTDEKNYNLKAGDILSLPDDIGKTLSKRGVAKELGQ